MRGQRTHADIGDIDRRNTVVPCSARQFEHTKAFAADGIRNLGLQPRRAGRRSILVGDVDLCKGAPPRNQEDQADDISNRRWCMSVGARMSMRRRDLTQNDIGHPGHRMDIAGGADSTP
jgi:hypothetical protein